jgi:hypothetical protein
MIQVQNLKNLGLCLWLFDFSHLFGLSLGNAYFRNQLITNNLIV